MMRKGLSYPWIMALVVVVIPLCAAVPVFAGEEAAELIESEGTGAIVQNDMALARDNAINDALRKAVEQAVGMFISSQTIVENFTVIEDNIYSRSQGYIRNYSIASEKSEETLYHVKVKASVKVGTIQNDLSALGLLMSRKGMPRLMVLMTERTSAGEGAAFQWDPTAPSVAEEVIQSDFLKDGFTFVDRTSLAKLQKVEGADISNDTARRFGDQVDAELVIAGSATAKSAGNVAGTAMKSYQATVTGRAIRTDNGVVIASATDAASSVHIEDAAGTADAIRKASEKLAANLKAQIIAKWQGEVASVTMVSMTVRGIKSYPDFVQFKSVLKSDVRGVKEIYQRSMKTGEAKIDVEVQGSAQSLADTLAVQRFDGFTVDITNVTENHIELNLIK